MQFTTAFVLAALPFLAVASVSRDYNYGPAVVRRSVPSDDRYVTLQRRADRVKTIDHKAEDWANANLNNPQAAKKKATKVATEAMQQGAAGPDGMRQSGNVRSYLHDTGSQPHPVVTVTTGHIGDAQVKTNHFGATTDSRGQPTYNGQNAQYTNDNKGKSKVVDPNARSYWDGPDKKPGTKRSIQYENLVRRNAEALAEAEAEAYADAYAAAYDDAYEEAFAMHKRDLEEQTLYARDLDAFEFEDLVARGYDLDEPELF